MPSTTAARSAAVLLTALGVTAAWFAWAWLPFGTLPLAALATGLGADAWRRSRHALPPPGLPRPMDAHTWAAYLAALLWLAVLVGYGADRIVLAGLAATVTLKSIALLRSPA